MFVDELDYKYVGNLQYAKGAIFNSKGKQNSPIIEDEVRAYLHDSGYTAMQVDESVSKLKNTARLNDKKFGSLLDKSREMYELLISGTKAKPALDENERDVMFFDFKDFTKNNFAIAEEVSFIDPLTGSHSRPDLIIYINGIAIAVIELKRSLVSLDEGIKQNLSNERDLIPSFFTTTQFTISASDSNGFKYATIGTPMEFWCPYRKDTNKTGIVLSDVESFKEFFDKEKLMFMFRYGVVTDCGIKKVMRPHQFHAVRAAVPRLEEKASGVIWHSQGSGKSLTMVWIANYIKANFEDPRVLVITDRTELDKQLSDDFIDTGNSLHRAKSSDDLLNTLQNGEEWLICTLIHKFGNHTTNENENENDTKIRLDKYLEDLKEKIKSKYPNGFKAKGKNIFIFIDECHRTQGGRLHEAMRAIMGQEVMLIGFTGTPLLKEDKLKGYNAYKNLSEIKFGTFIHKYLHKQAVEDEVIHDLQYEARDVDQYITQKDKLDEKLNEIIKGLGKERAQMVKDRWATLERVYSASERIERIGYSILDDVRNNNILRQDWCNAMLIAGDIYSAYKYYDFFQNKCSDKTLKNRCSVVTSYSPSDNDLRKDVTDTTKETRNKFIHDVAIQSLADAGVNDIGKYESWAKDKFIKQPALMKLIIVVDKLLTGFDAPCATFLYIDKYLRDHNLFQAICRVNRLGTDVVDENGNIITKTHKEFGLIVDFKHLFDNIENAITKFNDENGGLGGYDPADIEDLLDDYINKNKARLIAADKAFQALKAQWEMKGLTNNDLIAEFYMTDFDNDPADVRRTGMYKITEALVTAYGNMADYMAKAGFDLKEIEHYEKDTTEASHINLYVKQKSGDMFDVRNYDPDMRSLLDRFIRADEVDTIVPATSDFSFLDLIGDSSDNGELTEKTIRLAKGNAKAAAEVIEAKARAVINNYKEKDPAAFDKFSRRLEELLNSLHENTESFKVKINKLVELIKEAKNGSTSFPKEITNKRSKALWNNRDKWGASADDSKAVEQIKTIDEMIEYDAYRDWKDATSPDGVLFKETLRREFRHLHEEQIFYIYSLAVQNS